MFNSLLFKQKAYELCRWLLSSARQLLSVNAAWEVAVSAIISLIPLLATGVVELRFASEGKELLSTLIKPIGSGQLFIYGFAILATVFILLNDTDLKRFRKFALPIVVFLMIFIGIWIGADPKNTDITNRTIVASSYYFYFFCLIAHYVVLAVTRGFPPSFQATIEDGVSRLDRNSRKIESNA